MLELINSTFIPQSARANNFSCWGLNSPHRTQTFSTSFPRVYPLSPSCIVYSLIHVQTLLHFRYPLPWLNLFLRIVLSYKHVDFFSLATAENEVHVSHDCPNWWVWLTHSASDDSRVTQWRVSILSSPLLQERSRRSTTTAVQPPTGNTRGKVKFKEIMLFHKSKMSY